jgi:hypothetical protein
MGLIEIRTQNLRGDKCCATDQSAPTRKTMSTSQTKLVPDTIMRKDVTGIDQFGKKP